METLNCPWSGFTPGTTTFCEAKLCSWVESPAIAFAGIAYVLVAALIFRDLRKSDHPLLKAVGWTTLSMGVSSFLYHASHTLIFQAWDLASMFALAAGIAMTNVLRIFPRVDRGALYGFAAIVAGATALFIFLPRHPGVSTFIAVLAAGLLLEIPAARRAPRIPYRDFFTALGFFGVALVARQIEKSPTCDPDNHFFQWHAVWDTASAVVYGLIYRHYRSFFRSSV